MKRAANRRWRVLLVDAHDHLFAVHAAIDQTLGTQRFNRFDLHRPTRRRDVKMLWSNAENGACFAKLY